MVDAWLEAEAHQYHPAISHIVRQCVFLPMIGGARDQRVVDEHAGKLREALRAYDALLGERAYLAGDFVSLADLAHFGFTHYLMRTECAALVEERANGAAVGEAGGQEGGRAHAHRRSLNRRPARLPPPGPTIFQCCSDYLGVNYFCIIL